MVSADTRAVIDRAKRIYAEQLQTTLERHNANRYVAIEPESGEYFLGDTFDEAVKAARARHPYRLTHTIWIGHRAAFHLGGLGEYPLLGTMLLDGRRLDINYAANTVELT